MYWLRILGPLQHSQNYLWAIFLLSNFLFSHQLLWYCIFVGLLIVNASKHLYMCIYMYMCAYICIHCINLINMLYSLPTKSRPCAILNLDILILFCAFIHYNLNFRLILKPYKWELCLPFFSQHWLKFKLFSKPFSCLRPLSRSPYSRSYYSRSLSLTQVLSKATLLCPCSHFADRQCQGGCAPLVLGWAHPPAHCCSSQCSYQFSWCFYRVAPEQRHQNHFVAQCSLFKPYPTIPDPTLQLGPDRAIYHPLTLAGQWSECQSLEAPMWKKKKRWAIYYSGVLKTFLNPWHL